MFANRNFRQVMVAALLAVSTAFSYGSPANAQDEDRFPDLSALEPDTVVAVVNGNPINFAQIQYAHALLPADLAAMPLAEILPQVVQLVVEQRLLAEEAVSQGMHESVEYQAALQFQADRLLQERMLRAVLEDQFSDEALEIAYTVYSRDLPVEERVHARHILIAPASRDESDVRDALALAQDLIRQLNDGEDFATLADIHSDDQETAFDGGDLGFFPRGRMVPEFEEAAFDLEVGDFTQDAVTTPFGFHVIEVLDRAYMKASLEEVRGQLLSQLEAQRLALTLRALRESAEIQTIIETRDGDS